MKKTVITKIVGGLGNQMFQYAMAYSLAYDKSMELKLDTSWFSNMGVATPRDFELHLFANDIKYAEKKDLREMWGSTNGSRFARLISKFSKTRSEVVNEPSFRYCPDINKLEDSVYLNGYWQTEKYFSHNDQLIREQFTFPDIIDASNLSFADKIESIENSVSLHVRRGDYISDAHTKSYHGICNMEYYDKAIELVSSQFSNTHFFIFSDDPVWVMETFVADNITVITGNVGKHSFRDMQLMTLCKHHILANSSFSWWGAWLGKKNGSTIAPRTWFADNSIDTQDLYCKGWIKI